MLSLVFVFFPRSLDLIMNLSLLLFFREEREKRMRMLGSKKRKKMY